jgi:hypothetical protein
MSARTLEPSTNGRVHLPTRKRGRPSAAQQAQFEEELLRFAEQLQQINSRLDFKVSSRGWCYLLEEYALLKGDFDRAEKLINDCRRNGLLTLDFTAEEVSRTPDNLPEEPDDATPEEYAEGVAQNALEQHQFYTPNTFGSCSRCMSSRPLRKSTSRVYFFPSARSSTFPLPTPRAGTT